MHFDITRQLVSQTGHERLDLLPNIQMMGSYYITFIIIVVLLVWDVVMDRFMGLNN